MGEERGFGEGIAGSWQETVPPAGAMQVGGIMCRMEAGGGGGASTKLLPRAPRRGGIGCRG